MQKKIVLIKTMPTIGLIKLICEDGSYFFAKTGLISCDKDQNPSQSTVDHQRRMRKGEFDFSHAKKTHHLLREKELEKILESLERYAH